MLTNHNNVKLRKQQTATDLPVPNFVAAGVYRNTTERPVKRAAWAHCDVVLGISSSLQANAGKLWLCVLIVAFPVTCPLPAGFLMFVRLHSESAAHQLLCSHRANVIFLSGLEVRQGVVLGFDQCR